jgi:hypothetical protein
VPKEAPTSAAKEALENVPTGPAPASTIEQPIVVGTDRWRWESSLGIEAQVPADWAINDIDCGMSQEPTVARAIGASRLCLTPETSDKQVIEIAPWDSRDGDPPEKLVAERVQLGNEAARRALGQLKDGRFAAWLHVPRLQAVLSIRVKNRETMQRVLESVRVYEVDQLGCPLRRPPPQPPTSATLVPAVSELVVCYYGEGEAHGASARFDTQEAAAILSDLNAAYPRRNVDQLASECLRRALPPVTDLVLLARSASDRAVVHVGYSACTERGFYNGRNEAQLTESMLKRLMAPLHTGFSFGPLPP